MASCISEVIKIDTKHVCILCLERGEGKSLGGQFQSHSFRQFLSYIKITKADLLPTSGEGSSVTAYDDGDVNVKLTMCDGCWFEVRNFNALHKIYQLIRDQMDKCVEQVHQRMTKGDNTPERVREYETTMMSTQKMKSSKALADNLRKETQSKSYLRVALASYSRPRTTALNLTLSEVVSKLVSAVKENQHTVDTSNNSSSITIEDEVFIKTEQNSDEEGSSDVEPNEEMEIDPLINDQDADETSRKQVRILIYKTLDENTIQRDIKQVQIETDPLGDPLAESDEDPVEEEVSEPINDLSSEDDDKHLDASTKPRLSYRSLITQAIASAPGKKLTLQGIYDYIIGRYPFYKDNQKGWQNSVRHNLSMHKKTFFKVPRNVGFGTLKGQFWSLRPEIHESKRVQISEIRHAIQKRSTSIPTRQHKGKKNGKGKSTRRHV